MELDLTRLVAALVELDARVRTVAVPVASLADVVRSERAANRPRDQRVLPALREILARGSQGPDSRRVGPR